MKKLKKEGQILHKINIANKSVDQARMIGFQNNDEFYCTKKLHCKGHITTVRYSMWEEGVLAVQVGKQKGKNPFENNIEPKSVYKSAVKKIGGVTCIFTRKQLVKQ